MFVDSASRWMRPYGMKSTSETTMSLEKFLAEMNGMGTPRCFRTDNGGEFTGRSYTDYFDSAGIRREYRTPGKPQQNAVAKNAIWGAMKGGHAARGEVCRLFPDVNLQKSPTSARTVTDFGWRLLSWLLTGLTTPPPRQTLRDRSATEANIEWRSSNQGFFSRPREMQVVPFFSLA